MPGQHTIGGSHEDFMVGLVSRADGVPKAGNFGSEAGGSPELPNYRESNWQSAH